MIHHPTDLAVNNHYGVSTGEATNRTSAVLFAEGKRREGIVLVQVQEHTTQARIALRLREAEHMITLLQQAVEKIRENP
jgi:hypothetical protein